MSLKSGDWKMNENGAEGTLHINNVDPSNGNVLGVINLVGGPFVGGQCEGIWDETSRTVTLACPIPPPGRVRVGAPPPDPQRVYKGFLFSTPRNPAPGQDVLWTLAGFVQLTDVGDAIQMGGNARRTIFGWFAQTTEVE